MLRSTSAGSQSLLTDALGSTVATATGSGTIAGEYTYQPYGVTTLSGSDAGNAAQFTGRTNDGSGLYYYRNRYYDPSTGRFLSPDPSGLSGGTNPYEYAADQPTDLTDPLGLKPQGAVDESASTGTPPGEWVDPETINFPQRTVSPNDYVEVDGIGDSLDTAKQAGEAVRVDAGAYGQFPAPFAAARAAGSTVDTALGLDLLPWTRGMIN